VVVVDEVVVLVDVLVGGGGVFGESFGIPG